MKKTDLTGRNDLTRWNRAGLKQFRYIDGNAPVYLEMLRQALQQNFTDNGQVQWTELKDLFPEAADESVAKANQRFLDQYYDDRRDYAWEIIRTFSRSTHILTEYIDAYANESYLDTAVEWENVRRLVSLLGYQPAPPSSAETWLALLFKADQEGIVEKGVEKGIVEKGYAVKTKPAKGDSPVIYETLDDYQGATQLNQLRLKNWDQSQQRIKSYSSNRLVEFQLDEVIDSISVGNKGVLVDDDNGLCVIVDSVVENTVNNIEGSTLTLRLQNPNQLNINLATAQLFINPRLVVSPLPYSSTTLVLAEGHGVTDEMVIAIGKSKHVNGVTKVEKVTENRIILGKNYQGNKLTVLQKSKAQVTDSDGVLTSLPGNTKPRVWNSSFTEVDSSEIQYNIKGEKAYYLKGNAYQEVYFKPENSDTKTIIDSNPTKLEFSGKAGKLKSGDWVYLQLENTTLPKAVKIESIIQNETSFEVISSTLNGDKVGILQGNFEHVLRHKDANKNKEAAWDSRQSTEQSTAFILNNPIPKALGTGRRLIIKGKGGCKSVSIVSIDNNTRTIHVTPPLHHEAQAEDYETYSTLIFGNVVKAGHGETQVEKILGSGNNTEINQEYHLDVEDVSFISDAAFPRGVRADLMVRVDGRIWTQVSHLRFSLVEDHHYQVKIREDGTLTLRFGNGTNGRRLPSGIDNIRIKFRVGTGLVGNIEAGALVKSVRPHDGLDDFVHCIATSGGNDKESADSMRENAPASLLTLERAVSVTDFTHLVTQHSSVYQAHAFEEIPDIAGIPVIKIIIVPAGGGLFTLQQKELLMGYIKHHAVPGVDIRLMRYQPIPVQLAIRIEVDSTAWEPEAIRRNTLEYLLDKLKLEERDLGEALFRSTVVNLVEQVEGVENCHCTMTLSETLLQTVAASVRVFESEAGQIKRISVTKKQLIIINRSLVSVESREYSR